MNDRQSTRSIIELRDENLRLFRAGQIANGSASPDERIYSAATWCILGCHKTLARAGQAEAASWLRLECTARTAPAICPGPPLSPARPDEWNWFVLCDRVDLTG